MEYEDLAKLVLRRRGSMGIRAAANEIGISPTTLSRIERGHIPDKKTLDTVCGWLGEEPAQFTGIGELQIAFKAKTALRSHCDLNPRLKTTYVLPALHY